MAKPWKEVIQSEQYKSWSDIDRQKAQEEYFNTVVVPQVDDVNKARVDFYNAYPLQQQTQTVEAKKQPLQSILSVIKDPKAVLNVHSRYALSSTDKDRANVILNSYPDTTFRMDEENEAVIADIPGIGSGYLNAPGFSYEDIQSLAAQVPLYAGAIGAATKIPGIGKTAYGVTRKFISGALGSGAASAGMDLAREGEIDEGRVATTALVGGLAEKYAAPAVQWMMRKLGGKFFTAGGELSGEAKKLARKLGLTDDEVLKVARKRGLNEDDAIVAASFEKEGIPYTRGDITTKPGKIHGIEQSATEGQMGSIAQNRMGRIRQPQAEAEMATYTQRLGGNQNFRDAGAAVQEALDVERVLLRAKKTAAYNVAKNNAVEVDPDAVRKLVTRIQKELDVKYGATNIEKVIAKLDDISPKADTSKMLLGADGLPLRSGPPKTNSTDLFNIRRELSKLTMSKDPTTNAAATDAKRRFDIILDEMTDEILISADDSVITAWKNAIHKNAEYASRFKSRDLVGRLVKKDFATGEYALATSPDKASNMIFGLSDSKLFKGGDLSRDLVKVKEVLGESSEQWIALKQEAFMRIYRKAIRGQAIPETISEFAETFKPHHFSQAWGKIRQNNPEVVNVLFNEQERQLINRMAVISSNIAKTPPEKISQYAVWQNSLHRQATRIAFVQGAEKGSLRTGQMWAALVDTFFTLAKYPLTRGKASAMLPPIATPSPFIAGTITPSISPMVSEK